MPRLSNVVPSVIRVAAATVVLAALLVLLPDHAPVRAASGPPITNEHPTAGRGTHALVSDQLAVKPQMKPNGIAPAVGGGGAAPFMTRPYWNWHSLNSWFDHCNPDYSVDGVLCNVEGTVAYAANGVDPSFTKGYAATPGGTDYVYYDGHNGYDLGLWYEEVLAAAPGTVTVAGTDPVPYNACYGNTIVIDHGNGFSTRYAHLSSVDVTVGQHVDRGQHIGVSGTTGCSTGPHLHFGVYITSTWTVIDAWGWQGSGADPWPYDQGDLWLTGDPQNPVPFAPTNVAATSIGGNAVVTWTAPSFDGGTPISQYTVTAQPGGASVTVPGTQTSASIGGLTLGTAYTFTVTAANPVGTGPASAASAPITPHAAWPGTFVPLPPARILDTRDGTGGVLGPIQAGTWEATNVLGRAGVPATGVAAVVVNMTAVDELSTPAFLTAFPYGTAMPPTSNLNPGSSQPVASLAVVTVGTGGYIAVYDGGGGASDVVLDIEGYITDAPDAGTAGRLHPLLPARLLDTRDGTGVAAGPLAGGQALTLQVTGRGGVPAGGVGAVAVNLTAADATLPTYLTAYPAGTARPSTSNLNLLPGQIVANRILLPVNAQGQVAIFNFMGKVNAVLDVVGWYGTAADTGGSQYTGLTPVRLVDTRSGLGGRSTPLGGGQAMTISVAGQGGVPATGATAVVLDITVADGNANTYLTAYPTGSARPLASDLNVAPGDVRSNLVIAAVGSGGSVDIFNKYGTVDVLVDVVGWYG